MSIYSDANEDIIVPADDVTAESNDTLETAVDTELSSADSEPYTVAAEIGDNTGIDPELDVDLFAVELTAGEVLTVDVDAEINGSLLDSVVRIFDANGQEIAFNDDGFASDEYYTYDSFLEFIAETSGTYYIGVSGYGNSIYDPLVEGSGDFGSTGEYSLEVSVGLPNSITGTADADILTGTDGIDAIAGLAGDDLITALGGSDSITGDAGDDDILAGFGNDTVSGNNGNDTLFGEGDNDTLAGDAGADVIFGGDGDDTATGGEGNDRLFGDFGYDVLNGGAGNDVIRGGDEDDILEGAEGNDRLFGEYGYDSLYGDAGNDVLVGGEWDDTLDGGEGNDRLIGVDLNEGLGTYDYDVLTGGSGVDTFVLGDSDRLYYNDSDPLYDDPYYGYAVITDFDTSEDIIQLKGSAEFYSLDFYTDDSGGIGAALIYDPGVAARGETIALLENVSESLSIEDPAFVYV